MNKTYIIGFIIFCGIFSCNPKLVEIDLPDYESKLVVEGYLEEGNFLSVLVTESVSYFNAPGNPLVSDAKVTLNYKGMDYPLGFNLSSFKYECSEIFPREENEIFTLKVEQPSTGRMVTATTSFIPVVLMDTALAYYDIREKARIQFRFTDPGSQKNYYRLTAVCPWPEDKYDIELTDDTFNGSQAGWSTTASFKEGCHVDVRVYSLNKEYYDFLHALRNADYNNVAPVTEPSTSVGNIEGGLGIFTTLNYSEFTVKVPPK